MRGASSQGAGLGPREKNGWEAQPVVLSQVGGDESLGKRLLGWQGRTEPAALQSPRFVAPQSLPRPCRQVPGPPVHLLSLWAPLSGAVMCPAQPPPVLLCWGLAAPRCESGLPSSPGPKSICRVLSMGSLDQRDQQGCT